MKKNLLLLALIFVFVACGEKETPAVLKIKKDVFSLTHKERAKIEATTTSGNEIKYESSNSYVAKVGEDGEITAGVIGEAKITVSDGVNSKTCIVAVLPVYAYFSPEPVVGIGASKEELLSKLGEEDVTIADSSVKYVYDKGNPREAYIQVYQMENDRVKNIGVMFKFPNSVYMEGLTDYLLERYIPTGIEGNSRYFFKGKDDELFVVLDLGRSTSNITTIAYTKSKI